MMQERPRTPDFGFDAKKLPGAEEIPDVVIEDDKDPGSISELLAGVSDKGINRKVEIGTRQAKADTKVQEEDGEERQAA